MQIDKIYVIQLDHSQELIGTTIQKLNQLGLVGVPYEIIKAHNGRVDPLPEGYHAYEGWELPGHWNGWWNRALLPGEIGCAVSHLKVWSDVYEQGLKSVLILEEDFVVHRPLTELLQNGEMHRLNWDFCYLGRYRFPESPSLPVNELLEVPGNSYTSHAYLLTHTGARILLEGGLRENLVPVDEYIPAKYMAHRREDIEALFAGERLTAIATQEDWIGQLSNQHNTTIGHAQEPKFPELKIPPILDDRDWEAWLEQYVDPTIRQGEWDLIVDEHGDTNIFEFPLFTPAFCQQAIALAESADRWTVDRHQAYPTNDVLLNELGKLDQIYNRVIQEIISPLAIHLWRLEGDGYKNLHSENFLARYTMDRQSHLSLHHDFSHITMVVKLNDEFDGGGTWFPKYRVLSNPKRVGTATLHPGLITHLHGARPITAGRRYICVSFMRKGNTNI